MSAGPGVDDDAWPRREQRSNDARRRAWKSADRACPLVRRNSAGLSTDAPSTEVSTNRVSPAATAASIKPTSPDRSTDSTVSAPPRSAERAVVMTASTPTRADARKSGSFRSPRTTSTPASARPAEDPAPRSSTRTRSPRASRPSVTRRPRRPDAPTTRSWAPLSDFRLVSADVNTNHHGLPRRAALNSPQHPSRAGCGHQSPSCRRPRQARTLGRWRGTRSQGAAGSRTWL